MYNILQLKAKSLAELQSIADSMSIKKSGNLDFDALVYAILDQQAVDKAALKPTEDKPKPKRKRIEKIVIKDENNARPEKKTKEPTSKNTATAAADIASPLTRLPHAVGATFITPAAPFPHTALPPGSSTHANRSSRLPRQKKHASPSILPTATPTASRPNPSLPTGRAKFRLYKKAITA